MELKAWATSDPGRQRTNNEDAVLCDLQRGLFAVADGMGGHASGEVAADVALAVFSARLRVSGRRKLPDLAARLDRTARALGTAVKTASAEVHRLAHTRKEYDGMGSTLTAVQVIEDHAVAVHVGDSRLYIIRNGKPAQLTQDHTWAAELARLGAMTAEQAAQSPQRHVLARALGIEPKVQPDLFTFSLEAGDLLVLCSDGLTEHTEHSSDIARIVVENPAASARRLVHWANDRGGKDNVSVVVVQVGD